MDQPINRNRTEQNLFTMGEFDYFFISKNPFEFMPVAFRDTNKIKAYINIRGQRLLRELNSHTIFDDLILYDRPTAFVTMKTPVNPYEVVDFKRLVSEDYALGNAYSDQQNNKRIERTKGIFHSQINFFNECFRYFNELSFNDKYELMIHSCFLADVFSISFADLKNNDLHKKHSTEQVIIEYKDVNIDEYIIEALDRERMYAIFSSYNYQYKAELSDKNLFNRCRTVLLDNVIKHYPIALKGYF